MESGWIVAGLWVGLALLVACAFTLDALAAHRRGRILLLLTAVVLPLGLSLAGLASGMSRSSRTSVCTSCHEMHDYGRSLFVDNPESLAAVHYQRRLIPRETTCYACHTDYAQFGTLKAKLNGLMHIWVHHTGGPRGPIELYAPYPNYNCLHCHDDARSYVEVEMHRRFDAELHSGERSCLSCHSVGHDLQGVQEQRFWQPGAHHDSELAGPELAGPELAGPELAGRGGMP